MPEYNVRFSGSIRITAESKEAAIEAARLHQSLPYHASYSAPEVGVDEDELGWPITPAPKAISK